MDTDPIDPNVSKDPVSKTPLSDVDQRLLILAKRRILFRKHMVVYVLLIVLAWVLWLFNLRSIQETMAWPILPTVLGGVWVIILYYRAFVWGDKEVLIHREVEKLKHKKSK